MSNRAERRRAAREGLQRKHAVLIAGEGILAKAMPNEIFEAVPGAELPDKVPGKHRWIATAAYVISQEIADHAYEADVPKYLDQQSLFHLGIGCYDCERPLGDITADSVCLA
jgi:hypothetical protein